MARSHDSRVPNRALSGSGRAASGPRRSAHEIRPVGESALTSGLPGPDHAHLAASSQRFMGGHNLTELRTDLARVTFLLDHDDDEGLFGRDPLS
jgi:hypothetical protein